MSTVNGILGRKFFKCDELADNLCTENNCTVALYKAVGIINIPFLLLYFSECGATFKVTTIDVYEQNSCQEVAIFTVLT